MGKLAVFFIILFCASLSLWPERSVIVGITDTPPLVFEDNGKVSGFFIDILEDIAKKEGWTVFYKPATLDECMRLLEEKKIDLIADIGYSSEREKRMNFNETNVLMTWAAFYTKNGENIVDYNDLEGKRIAVESGDYFIFEKDLGLESTLRRLGIRYEFVRRSGYREVLQAVISDSADVGVVNKIYGKYTFKSHKLSQSDLIFLPVSLRYSSVKGDSSLIRVIDNRLAEMKRDEGSVYYKSLSKHIEKDDSDIPLWFLIAAGAIIALTLAVSAIYLMQSKAAVDNAMTIIKKEEASLAYTKVVLSQLDKTLYDILDVMPIGVVCIDENDKIEYLNNEAEEIFFKGGTNKDVKNIWLTDAEGRVFEDILSLKSFRNHEHKIRSKKFFLRQGEESREIALTGIEFYDPVKDKKHALFTVEDVSGQPCREDKPKA